LNGPKLASARRNNGALSRTWRGLERRHLVTLQRLRHQGWRVDRGEGAGAAAGQLLERHVVESREQWGYSLIDLVHVGELLNRSARLISRLCSTITPKTACALAAKSHPRPISYRNESLFLKREHHFPQHIFFHVF
jgi:hypothetical protein